MLPERIHVKQEAAYFTYLYIENDFSIFGLSQYIVAAGMETHKKGF